MLNDRLTRRFLRHDPDILTDAELLELLLRFALPAEKAQWTARTLLEHFSCIEAVLNATADDLRVVDGMEEEALILLRLVPELQRRYFLSRSAKETYLTDTNAYGNFLLPYFYGAKEEWVYLLALDGAGKVLSCRALGEGGINSANVPTRKLVQEAVNCGATAVVLAHNHPSGIALPSKADIALTLRLKDTLDILDILLLDHIVVADDDYISMRESGYLGRY